MKPEADQAQIRIRPEDSEQPASKEPTDQRRKTGSIITIVGSALANLSDGYQQSLASSTNVVFSHVLGKEIYNSERQTRISNSLLVGSVVGILIFGYVSDRLSRKGGMLVTSGLVVVGSLMSALAFQVDDARHMLWFMTVARGMAGVGVGGGPKIRQVLFRRC
jgi:MFS family permease